MNLNFETLTADVVRVENTQGEGKAVIVRQDKRWALYLDLNVDGAGIAPALAEGSLNRMKREAVTRWCTCGECS